MQNPTNSKQNNLRKKMQVHIRGKKNQKNI